MASSTPLSGKDLLSMSQFKQDGNGKYYDYIQRESMQDFYTILQYYMDSELREMYMGMRNPPSLDPTVKQIADTNGSPTTDQKANGDDGVASTWYKTLSVAYLTQVLPSAFPSDDYAGKLNTIRAKQWLKTETSTSSVYTVQSSDLYKNRWMDNIPLTGQYIVDQLQNQTTYNTHIDQDKSTWKAEIEATVVDSDNLTSMKSILEEITRIGKERKYWAYWLFRDLTQPNALLTMKQQTLSIGGAASLDGSAFSRRIQQNCAMLGILDSSAEFQEQYVKIIQVFLLTNIVPQLLDFSGDMTHYTYAIMEILRVFVEMYINSTDPQMQYAASEIEANLSQNAVKDLLSVLQVSAAQMATDYSLSKLLVTVEGLLDGVPVGKVMGKFVIGAALSAGITMFYFGVLDWSQLSTSDKVKVVSEGTVLFTEVAGAIVKRGATIYQLWGTEAMGFKNAGKILLTGDCQESMIRASNGLSKWLMQRKGQVEVGVNTAAASEEAIVAGEQDMALMQNLFGRNLDEFIATRFGAAVAILGLVYGSISHSRSHSKVGNALGVTASALQLTATMGAWLLPETVEGIEAATILASSGALAVGAATAGVIIYIIAMEEFRETPIEYFAKHQASAAGLYMEHGADIDSFKGYQPTGQLEKEGISLLMGGSSSQYMKFSLDGTLALAETTNGPDTVFYLITDAYGRAKFIANLPNADNSAIESKFLTIDGTGKLSGTSLLTGSSAYQQIWVAEIQGSVNRDSDGHLQSASFKFYSYYWYKNHSKKYYLGGSNNVPSTAESNQQEWTVSMASTKPVDVSMDNIILYTYQKDQTFQPTLLNPGSDPRTWSIRPALPDFMELDTSTGTVSQKSGLRATVTAADTYTLTVTNALGSSSTTFTFDVQVLVF